MRKLHSVCVSLSVRCPVRVMCSFLHAFPLQMFDFQLQVGFLCRYKYKYECSQKFSQQANTILSHPIRYLVFEASV